MSPTPTPAYANRLLLAFPPADLALIEPHLTLVTLALGEVLIRPTRRSPMCTFVERGIVSLVAVAHDGEQIETGLIGREGLIGTSVLLVHRALPNEARVQAAGLAHAVPVDAVRELLRSSPKLHERLLRCAQLVNTQIACTALANGPLPGRAAPRTLAADVSRPDGRDVLPTTHRFLLLMLGVNRPHLTTELAALERERHHTVTRAATITICDRDALLARQAPPTVCRKPSTSG